MYKRLFISSKNIDTDPHESHASVVEYYLIQKGDVLNRDYGICVSKILDDAIREEIMSPDISTSRIYIEGLLDLLMKNGVTPVAAHDVVMDFVS